MVAVPQPPQPSEYERNIQRYYDACHAIQSGVKFEMEISKEESKGGTTPKQLRTGINIAMSDNAALVDLLIAKGIITIDEHAAALADAAEREVKRYETKLSQMLGGKDVKLI